MTLAVPFTADGFVSNSRGCENTIPLNLNEKSVC